MLPPTTIYLVGVLAASQETDHLVAQAVRMGMHRSGLLLLSSLSLCLQISFIWGLTFYSQTPFWATAVKSVEKITLAPVAAALSKLLVFYHKTGIAVYPQRSKITEYRRLRVIIK